MISGLLFSSGSPYRKSYSLAHLGDTTEQRDCMCGLYLCRKQFKILLEVCVGGGGVSVLIGLPSTVSICREHM